MCDFTARFCTMRDRLAGVPSGIGVCVGMTGAKFSPPRTDSADSPRTEGGARRGPAGVLRLRASALLTPHCCPSTTTTTDSPPPQPPRIGERQPGLATGCCCSHAAKARAKAAPQDLQRTRRTRELLGKAAGIGGLGAAALFLGAALIGCGRGPSVRCLPRARRKGPACEGRGLRLLKTGLAPTSRRCRQRLEAVPGGQLASAGASVGAACAPVGAACATALPPEAATRDARRQATRPSS